MNPPCPLHNYQLALQNLKSLAPNFKCGICLQTLKDTYYVSNCVCRFCAKCIRERPDECGIGDKGGGKCPFREGGIPNRSHAVKDCKYELLVNKLLNAIKHLEEYDKSTKEKEASNTVTLISDYAGKQSQKKGQWYYQYHISRTNESTLRPEQNIQVEELQQQRELFRLRMMDSHCDVGVIRDNQQETSTRAGGSLSLNVISSCHGTAAVTTNGTENMTAWNAEKSSHTLTLTRPKPTIFDQRIDELLTFRKTHGHCKVPGKHPTLGPWCKCIRGRYNGREGTIPLTAEEIRRLEEVGFVWGVPSRRMKKTFDQRIQELLRFKDTYGHCDVPVRHPSLGNWQRYIRKQYKKIDGCGPLSAEKIRRLEEVGFQWTGARKKNQHQRNRSDIGTVQRYFFKLFCYFALPCLRRRFDGLEKHIMAKRYCNIPNAEVMEIG